MTTVSQDKITKYQPTWGKNLRKPHKNLQNLKETLSQPLCDTGVLLVTYPGNRECECSIPDKVSTNFPLHILKKYDIQIFTKAQLITILWKQKFHSTPTCDNGSKE
ncbi:hypothetical protein M8J77_002506 [Diaphorina citri]|nr:hypothetical protein M8J77_002506 [Diaphorina citri]